jgi:hypothetical protein
MEQRPASDPAGDTNASFPPAPVSTTPSPVHPRSRRSALFSGSAILVLAALVAVGGVTFAVGRLTAPTAAAAARTGIGGGNGNFGNGNFGNGPRASGAPGAGRQGGLGGIFGGGAGLTVRGTVTSVTADALTLTLPSGATVEIPLQASTTYHDQSAGTKSDVQTGREVLVQLSGANGSGGNAPGSAGSSPAPSGGQRLGAAQDVTVVAP